MRIVILILLSCLAANAENIIHNSSFECGQSGWVQFGNFGANIQEGNIAPTADHIVSTNGIARHGNKAIWFNTLLWSRPFWLTNGYYTRKFDARADTAYTMNWGSMRTFKLSPLADAVRTETNNAAVTTSWQTFTDTFYVPTNGWHCFQFYNNVNGSATYMDRVQIERGSNNLAPYAPQTLEVGIDFADSYNNLFLSDTKQARFQIWNEGPATNITIVYQDVHGIYNSNISAGVISTNALSANTNTTINLTLSNVWGPHRLFCYITNVNATWSEKSVTMLPFAAQSGRDTNGLLGIHVAWTASMIGHQRRIGFTWARYFSPANWSRWDIQFPTLTTTNAANIWLSDYMYAVAATNDLVPFIELTPSDGIWYTQTNSDMSVMIGDWTNYVGRMVYRFGNPPYNVSHFEIFNEPQQDRSGIDTRIATNYANIYTNAVNILKIIKPTATVIAFGGYSDAGMASDAWNAIGSDWQSTANMLSFHIYPIASGGSHPWDDPNVTEDYNSQGSGNFDLIRSTFLTNKLWNTETATRDIGSYHTINASYWFPYYFSDSPSSFSSEAHANELEVRGLPAVDRATYNFLRTVGWGFTQYNLQYGRAPDHTMFEGNTPTIYELDASLKPWAAALCIANHFVKTPGLGRTYVSAMTGIEAYLHTNTLGTVMSIFCNTRGSGTLTTTNGFMAVYDTCGNLIQTNSTSIPVTRSARYLVSGVLSASQMSATIGNASWMTNQDTIAPFVTIDMSPVGYTTAWGGITNVFKATAIDERVMQYANTIPTDTQTNVQYRWSLNGGSSWSPWGATNHFYHSFPSAGIYTVQWQAKDQANNVSATVSTPAFGDLANPPGEPTILNISGTANIGTITIAP